MSVNYTPTFENYSGQGKFRFWCQTVLPLVYDDALSYMELLNRVVNYLNNTIQDVAAMEDNVDELLSAYNQLQAYVNDYFDNLDVQQEINNKLDSLVDDGTMDELIEPFITAQVPGLVEENLPGVVENQIGDVVANQIDDVVEEQIPGVVADQIPSQVSDWLNENVDPVGSAVIVDSSLSISGAAADSEVVGNEFDDVMDALNLVDDVFVYNALSFEAGAIILSNNIWSAGSGIIGRALKIKPSDVIELTAGANDSYYTFLQDVDGIEDGEDAHVCSGYTRTYLAANTTRTLTAPADAKYLFFSWEANSVNYAPSRLIVNGYDALKGVRDNIEYLKTILADKEEVNFFEYELGLSQDSETISDDLFELGGISYSTGDTASATNRIRTSNYISKNIRTITCENGAQFAIYAWQNETYQGVWNGSTFQTTSVVWNETLDIYTLSEYDLKIAIRNITDEDIATTYASNCTIDTFINTFDSVKDKADKIYNFVNTSTEYFPKFITFKGTLTNSSSTNRIHILPSVIKGGTQITRVAGYEFAYYYTGGNSGWKTSAYLYEDTAITGIVIRKSNDGDFSSDDIGVSFENFITVSSNTCFGQTLKVKSDDVLNKWMGKKVAFMGDSITAGSQTTEGKRYYDLLNEKLHFIKMIINGVYGSCYSVTSDYGSSPAPLSQRYPQIPTDCDLVILFAGTNDYGHNSVMGTINDTTDVSFYGAVSTVITGIITANPSVRLAIMTPLHRKNENNVNSLGYNLYDYVQALKNVAQKYSIPVIDTYNISGMNPVIPVIKTNYMPDGLHPVDSGHARLAEAIINHVIAL